MAFILRQETGNLVYEFHKLIRVLLHGGFDAEFLPSFLCVLLQCSPQFRASGIVRSFGREFHLSKQRTTTHHSLNTVRSADKLFE